MACASDEILVVTVATPSYRHLLPLMRSGLRRNLRPQQKLTVIRVSDAEGFAAKLNLDKHLPRRRIVFMDADTLLLREFDLSRWTGDWLAVPDPSTYLPHTFPQEDCESLGLDKNAYWNSGFFACDLRRKEHRDVFKAARASLAEKQAGKITTVDWTDQIHFSRATQMLGTPITFLPFANNFYPHCVTHGARESYPRNIVLAHAAGFPIEQKKEAMAAMRLIFGADYLPMADQALRQIHKQQHDWR
jgi:hypothetical protein